MRIFFCILLVIVSISCNNPKGSKNDTNKASVYPVFVQDLIQAVDRFPDSTELRVQLIDTMDSLNQTKDALLQIDALIARHSGN